jgi:hypothetical protein
MHEYDAPLMLAEGRGLESLERGTPPDGFGGCCDADEQQCMVRSSGSDWPCNILCLMKKEDRERNDQCLFLCVKRTAFR